MPVETVVSNHIESLALELSASLSSNSLTDPFHSEWIVVNSSGMESWLRRQLCFHMGICGNLKFPFLSYFVDLIVQRHEPYKDFDSAKFPFSRKQLVWRIYKLLRPLIDNGGKILSVDGSGNDQVLKPVVNYLMATSHKELALYQLSGRLASLFDQYQLFRPHMLRDWESPQSGFNDKYSEDVLWQKLLWQALNEVSVGNETSCENEPSVGNKASVESRDKTLFKVMSQMDDVSLSGIERVSVFGVSTMAPVYLDFFCQLSTKIPVTMYLLNPSCEYWDDIVSEQVKEKRESQGRQKGIKAEQLHFSTGNSLLSSCGMVGQQFFKLLADKNCESVTECFSSSDIGRDFSLLQKIQTNILKNENAFSEPSVSETDRSLQIHSCHTIAREVEVLKDHLLEMFAEDKLLKPSDVLVMAPDISDYVTDIESVFAFDSSGGKAPSSRRNASSVDTTNQSSNVPFIPYTISDRSRVNESKLLSVFEQLLNIRHSRFEASALFDILSLGSLSRAFHIEPSELGLLSKWIDDTGIMWGWNCESRKEVGLPSYSSGSWIRGIDRLLSGYAMSGNFVSVQTDISLGYEGFSAGTCNENSQDYVVPYTEIDGDFSDLLGRFLNFIKALRNLVLTIPSSQSLLKWQQFIAKEIIAGFFDVAGDDDHNDLLALSMALEDLSGIDVGEVSIDVISDYIHESIASSLSSSGFYRGKLTFCSLLPMRSVPAKVICLLGMGLGDFPRQDKPSGFDLMAQKPQSCDRSRRADDRYLFLEAILAAREKLYISYIGRSREDNTLVAPSVLVAELKETISTSFDLPPSISSAFDGHTLEYFEFEERLQPFSHQYFSSLDSRHFSYSVADFEGARARLSQSQASPFLSGLVFPDFSDSKPMDVDFYQLLTFLRNPSAYLLKSRLGIFNGQTLSPSANLEDEFADDALFRWKIRKVIYDYIVTSIQLASPLTVELLPSDFYTPELRSRIKQYIFGQGLMSESFAHESVFSDVYTEAQDFASSLITIGEKSYPISHIAATGISSFIELELPVIRHNTDFTSTQTGYSGSEVGSCVDGGDDTHVGSGDDVNVVNLSGPGKLIFNDTLVFIRPGSKRFIDIIELLIQHMAASITGKARNGSVFISQIKDKNSKSSKVNVERFAPMLLDAAENNLGIVLQWYYNGLLTPLPFFPSNKLFDKAVSFFSKMGTPPDLVQFNEMKKTKGLLDELDKIDFDESVSLCFDQTKLSQAKEFHEITGFFVHLYCTLSEVQ